MILNIDLRGSHYNAPTRSQECQIYFNQVLYYSVSMRLFYFLLNGIIPPILDFSDIKSKITIMKYDRFLKKIILPKHFVLMILEPISFTKN